MIARADLTSDAGNPLVGETDGVVAAANHEKAIGGGRTARTVTGLTGISAPALARRMARQRVKLRPSSTWFYSLPCRCNVINY